MKYRFILLILLITFVTCTSVAQVKRHLKTQKVKDPVCGLMVDKDPELSVKYADVFYYFCSKADMEQFKKQPAKYARKQPYLTFIPVIVEPRRVEYENEFNPAVPICRLLVLVRKCVRCD